jgi:hypothetical protein
MKPATLLSFTIALLCCTSCATIVHGPLQKFILTSDPRTASIYIDGKPYGHTPTVIRMTRRKNHKLVLSVPGYEPYEVTFKRKVDAWTIGNVVTGAVPGLAIDFLTGSIYKLTPGDIYPTLRAHNLSSTPDAVVISITLKPSQDWVMVGSLKKIQR